MSEHIMPFSTKMPPQFMKPLMDGNENLLFIVICNCKKINTNLLKFLPELMHATSTASAKAQITKTFILKIVDCWYLPNFLNLR